MVLKEEAKERLPGVGPADIPQHLIQCGNDRLACFNCDKDLAVYAS